MPYRSTWLRGWMVFGLLLILSVPAVASVPEGPGVPVALVWGRDGFLRVALRDAQQLVTIEPGRWEIVARLDLPIRPVSLSLAEDGATWLVGGMDGEALAVRGRGLSWLRRADGRGPVRVAALNGGRVAVGARWAAAIEVLDLATANRVRTIQLGFPVGAMIRRPDGRLVVAEAFGGQLADIDSETGRVIGRQLDGINLRGLALSGDGRELLVAHMAQYNSLPITASNIDWGLVISSHLSAVPLTTFEVREGGTQTRRLALDGSRHGAADPSAIAVSRDGKTLLVVLTGAHQVLKDVRTVGSAEPTADGLLPLGQSQRLETINVGRSPMDVTLDPSDELAITADAMSDTLTVFRVAEMSVVKTVPLAPADAVRTAAQRGEAVFLDGRRSLDRWMSCDSCHNAGHTVGLNFDTLGDGGYGAPKNTPSLLGVGRTAPYSWVGRFETLEDQITHSLETSLRGPSTPPEAIADLAAYLRTLTPPPARRPADDPQSQKGAALFRKVGCDTCHRPPTYAGKGQEDVGLDDGAGEHELFNPPSLRGVGWSAPYFHDGRAASLDQVIETHYVVPEHPLDANDRADLKAFLESL